MKEKKSFIKGDRCRISFTLGLQQAQSDSRFTNYKLGIRNVERLWVDGHADLKDLKGLTLIGDVDSVRPFQGDKIVEVDCVKCF